MLEEYCKSGRATSEEDREGEVILRSPYLAEIFREKITA